MKSFRKEVSINVPTRTGFVNITPQVETAICESKISEGICLVNSLSVTASVFVNEDEIGLQKDFEVWLEKLAPQHPKENYQHHLKPNEDNGDAHLKRTIMGREVTCAITNGKLDFGTWEQIFYGEFDGMRNKKVLIKIIGE